MKPGSDIEKLRDVLEQEHAALLRGDFAHLDQLTGQKETLLRRLSKTALSTPGMAEISALTVRNQKMLRSAIEGVDAARQTLSKYADAKKGSVVYASDGSVSRLATQAQGVSRKV